MSILLPLVVSETLLDEWQLTDQMLYSVASCQGIHFLLKPVCPNIYDLYGESERGVCCLFC